MKYILLILLFTTTTFSQIGINTVTPDSSSELDISSTDGGILIPRMTNAQRDGISTPAEGLMIYQTNAIKGFYYFDGSNWKAVDTNGLDGVSASSDELNILDGVTSTAAELNILDGVTSTSTELNILDGVTSTAAELNLLDGVTSLGGANIPVYTNDQVSALSPQQGDLIYNKSTQKLQIYTTVINGSVLSKNILQSNSGYVSYTNNIGNDYDYHYSATINQDMIITDLGVDQEDAENRNEYDFIIYKDDDFDISNGVGTQIQYNELIPSGTKIHIGFKGSGNQRVYWYTSKPSIYFFDDFQDSDNGWYHNLKIYYKYQSNTGWNTISTF